MSRSGYIIKIKTNKMYDLLLRYVPDIIFLIPSNVCFRPIPTVLDVEQTGSSDLVTSSSVRIRQRKPYAEETEQ